MPANSFSRVKVNKKLFKFFDKSVINRVSRQTGFQQRKRGKINGYYFVAGFVLMCQKGCQSFSAWAEQISLLTGQFITRQAIWERLYRYGQEFTGKLLQHYLSSQTHCSRCVRAGLFSHFKAVFLQDSTTIALPDSLADCFKGSCNQQGQTAIARITSVFNILSGRFHCFTITPYCQNDQSHSGWIVPQLSRGTLLIRDLGYFVLSAFKTMNRKGVYFLSRLRPCVNVYDSTTGAKLKLIKAVRSSGIIDKEVLLGKEQCCKVRLVMIPLPRKVADERRRKARQDRNKRLNHNREYYQLLGYHIYITNVSEQWWTAQQINQAYRCRWKIEIVFKSWKSGFRLQAQLHDRCDNETRVHVVIHLILLFILLFHQHWYQPYETIIAKRTGKKLSLLKMAARTASAFIDMLSLSKTRLLDYLAKYCCYEKRNDRINMTDLLTNQTLA
jgi:hypothetical protein